MESIIGDQTRGRDILAQVGQGTIPSEWRVVTANGQFFVRQGLLFGVGAVFLLGIGGLLVAAGTDGHNDGAAFLLLAAIFMLLLGVAIVQATVIMFLQVARASEQRLVFMPDGIAQYGVRTLRKRTDRVIFYEHVAAMQVTSQVVDARSGQQAVAVAVTPRVGTSFEWDIDDRFGPKYQTGSMIAAAFVQYQGQHVTAQR